MLDTIHNNLSIIIFLPLVGSLFLLMMKDSVHNYDNIKAVSILISACTFFLSLLLLTGFDSNLNEYQFVKQYALLSNIKISYNIGLDGYALVLVILTTFVSMIAIFAVWKIEYKLRDHLIAIFILETCILGIFSSVNIFLFYIFFEATLIPMLFIIGIWGGKNKIYACFKFFIYTMFGSVFMLIAIIYTCKIAKSGNLQEIANTNFLIESQKFLWLGFFLAFAIKIPMFPFHTWLPDAHVEAPNSGSIILAGLLLKAGSYGFIRILLPIFPEASKFYAPYILILSVIAVIYASLVALVQKDIKKMVAYSSIVHMGFVTFGIFTFNQEALQGSIVQMISHGLISAGLFFSIGVLYDRIKTRNIAECGGIIQKMPFFSKLVLILILASIGFPGTSGFIGELFIILSSIKFGSIYTLILILSVIFSAGYLLWMYKRVFLGVIANNNQNIKDITFIEKTVILSIITIILIIGIYPNFLIKISQNILFIT